MEELNDVINVPREKLWTQAMLFACDVTNKSVTTSTDGGKSPYELWFGKFYIADHLRPFGAVGYARQSVREHKMAPKGEKCVFMGISRNFPTGTVSVLLSLLLQNCVIEVSLLLRGVWNSGVAPAGVHRGAAISFRKQCSKSPITVNTRVSCCTE